MKNIFIPDTTPLTADEVREMRAESGLTADEMSDKFGISVKTWRYWERNGCSPAWSFLVREVLDGAVDDISQTRLSVNVLEDLIDLLGGYNKFYQTIGISSGTLDAWKKKGVASQSGWGRALTIMAELNGIGVE